jgi:DivIVA domain-containing protein
MTADGSDRSFGAPRFDVVLRGYDRRQVDEHLSRLNRVLARMRSDLESARSRPESAPLMGPPPPPGARPRPTPRPRPGDPPGEQGDVVGTFTERMQTILQAAEEEAAEIRAKAQAAARAVEERSVTARASVREEEEAARSELAHLVRQRDAVLADLTRVRGQLEALLSGPTARITVPAQDGTTLAAARRDAGAGQPLPGATPAGGALARPVAPTDPDPAGRTAVLRPPALGPASPPGGERPVGAPEPPAPVEERPAEESPSELTVVVSLPDDEEPPASPDDGDPEPGAAPAEATVKVGAVGRPPAGGGAGAEDDPDTGDRPTNGVEPASASRRG